MLMYSSVQAPPIKDMNESNTSALYQEATLQWHLDSEARHESMLEEMELEREYVERAKEPNVDEGALAVLEARAAENRIYTEEAAILLNRAMTRYHVEEAAGATVGMGRVDPTKLPNGRPKVQTTLSSSPKAKTALSPYSSRGVLRIQLEHLRRMRRSLDSDLQKAAGISDSPGPENLKSMGWQAPWNQESIPRGIDLIPSTAALHGKSSEAILQASRLHREINEWAASTGHLKELEANSELYPYFFVVMEMEKTRNQMFQMMQRKRERGEPIDPIEMRNMYLAKLRKVTQMSRDILKSEGKSMEFEDKIQPIMLKEKIDNETFRELLLGDKLARDILNKTALEAGPMPSEGITIRSGEENLGEGFENPEDIALQIVSTLVQSSDYPSFVLKSLLERYRVQAIRRILPHHPHRNVIERTHNLWDSDLLTRKEKAEINQEILIIARESEDNDLVFEGVIHGTERAYEKPQVTM